MKEFLKNILPRLKAHSKELDITESIIEKPWIWISETDGNQKMVFRRDGTLLMVNNGDVKTGSWEYISALNSFLIDRGVDKLLMNYAYVTDAIMLLKKDGASDDDLLAFVNEAKIPSLDYEEYLNNIVNKQLNSLSVGEDNRSFQKAQRAKGRIKDGRFINELWLYDLKTNKKLLINNHITDLEGQKLSSLTNTPLYFNGSLLADGYYEAPNRTEMSTTSGDSLFRMIYYIVGGTVIEEFDAQPYKKHFNGRNVNIYYQSKSILEGSAVLYEDSFDHIEDGKYNCGFLSNIIVADGRVIHEVAF